MTQRHATRTYRGRPACAGSQLATTPAGACSVCGRDDIGDTWGTGINTHIHRDDLASAPSAPVHNTTPDAPVTATPEVEDAIRTFYADSNKHTFNAMNRAMPTGFNYVRFAREHGIEQAPRKRI